MEAELASFDQRIDHMLRYEFTTRMIKEENKRRKEKRDQLNLQPDSAFEMMLAEIRRKTRAGIFPDQLIDKTISQTLCDPNSFVRKFALSTYGFTQADLQPFAFDNLTEA